MKKWLIWGFPSVLLIGLIGWRFTVNASAKAKTAGSQQSRQRAAASVEVAVAGPRTITNVLQSVGSVESPYKVEISPKSAGRISYLELREGDPVKAGQIVLKIDPSDLEGAVVQAQANVADARSKLAQAKITQNAANVGVSSQVKQQKAA
ncbi:MAG: biotin/lipoyl-binding protein, partial [Fimbriimonadales bacterium]